MNEADSNKDGGFTGNGMWSRRRLRGIALAIVTAVGLYICYRLAVPCVPSLAWAGALALIFAPLQRWMEKKLPGPNLSAALSLVIIGLLVIAPATWVVQKGADEAARVAASVQQKIASGKWRSINEDHQQLASMMQWVERRVNLPETAASVTRGLNSLISSLIEGSLVAVVQLSLTLYFLFYLLRDRVPILAAIRSLLPLTESETDLLFSRVNKTIHATVYGMLAISALQGVLGGAMYWWFGVPSPWLWALVMAGFAVVPVVGEFVMWIPAAIYLGLEGRWTEALIVAGIGTLLVRAVENVLYPILVKNRLGIHPTLIFVAVIGGLILFGLSGLVLGPVILSVTISLLEVCANRAGETRIVHSSASHLSQRDSKTPLYDTDAMPRAERGANRFEAERAFYALWARHSKNE